jgi:hypothetical protein
MAGITTLTFFDIKLLEIKDFRFRARRSGTFHERI